jgi:hypothetical protein
MTFPVFTPGADLTQPQLLNEMSGLYRPNVTDDQLDRLYSTGSAIYAAINYRMFNLGLVRWKVFDDNNKALPANDPMNMVLSRGMQDIVRRSELALCLRGRNLIYKVRNRFTDEIARLQWINFKRYRLDKDYRTGLSGFFVNTGSNDKPVWANYIDIDDAIYFTLVDPDDDFDGVAPAEVVFAYAGVDVELGSYLLARFQNMGIPNVMLMPRADNSDQIDDEIVKEEADAMRRQTKGTANAGRTYFTPYRWDIEKLQDEISNFNTQAISPGVREIIFTTLGVGMSLISANASNFAQTREERMAWIRTWMMPQAHWYAGHLTDQYVALEHPGYRVEPEFDRVPDALEALAQQTASVNSQVTAGYRDLYSAQLAANDRLMPPDERLKGYYMIAGKPTKVEDFDKLQMPPASPFGGGFGGGAMSAPTTAEPPEPTIEHPVEAPTDPPAEIKIESPVALKAAEADAEEWMPEAAFKELQNWRRVIARKGTDYAFEPKVLPAATVTFGTNLLRHGSNIDDACKAMKAHYFVATKSVALITEFPDAVTVEPPEVLSSTEAPDAADKPPVEPPFALKAADIDAIKDSVDGLDPDPSAVPTEFFDYWRDYDKLQADIGNTWLEQYQAKAWGKLEPMLAADTTDADIEHILGSLLGELYDGWVGTTAEPGPLLALTLAGMAAGDRALAVNGAANPHRPAAAKALWSDVVINWKLLNYEALDFIKRYLPSLIRNVTQTTLEQTRAAIQKWTETGQSLDALKEVLNGIFHDKVRAAAIAETETTRMYAAGSVERYRKAGVSKGRWFTVNVGLGRADKRPGDVCRICTPRHNMVADFAVGFTIPYNGKTYLLPPAHVRCRCYIRPVLENHDDNI